MKVRAVVTSDNGNMVTTDQFDSAESLAEHLRGVNAVTFTLNVTFDSLEDTKNLASVLPVLAECFSRKGTDGTDTQRS